MFKSFSTSKALSPKLRIGSDIVARNWWLPSVNGVQVTPNCAKLGLVLSRVKGDGSVAEQGSQGPWLKVSVSLGLHWLGQG